MGTNFYWHIDVGPSITLPTGEVLEIDIDQDNPVYHLGKRSAAGYYCWTCGITLCKQGNDAIHGGYASFYDRCPKCGAEKVKEGLDAGPAAIELGFAQPRVARPTGVRGCSSFSWAQSPEQVRTICRAHPDDELVDDEYGRTFTGQQFMDMLENNCPIEFTNSVGKWFS